MKDVSPTPSKELLTRIRAGFILKGSSFNAWCRSNGVVRRTAEQSISGEIQSENAKQLVQKALEAVKPEVSLNG